MSLGTALIECADHMKAPASVVCTHLLDGTATEWIGLPSPPDDPVSDYDFLCPACFDDLPNLGADGLQTVCLHCLKRNRSRPRARQRPRRGIGQRGCTS